MARIVSIDDVAKNEVRTEIEGGAYRRTDIFQSDIKNTPLAFLVKYDPGKHSSTHYHEEDEYQLVVGGKGLLGRHVVSPYTLHFARAYTPYGPLQAERGDPALVFLTLRRRPTKGAFRLPEFESVLKQMANRKPWQTTYLEVKQPSGISGMAPAEEGICEIRSFAGDKGRAAYSMILSPHTSKLAPSPAGTDGQYIVIVEGSLLAGQEKNALTVISIEPDEPAFLMQAGSRGLKAFVLNFPALDKSQNLPETKIHADGGVWQCKLCAYAYDHEAGAPEDGFAPGTLWEDVDASWKCPDCGAPKSDFEMIEG